MHCVVRCARGAVMRGDVVCHALMWCAMVCCDAMRWCVDLLQRPEPPVEWIPFGRSFYKPAVADLLTSAFFVCLLFVVCLFVCLFFFVFFVCFFWGVGFLFSNISFEEKKQYQFRFGFTAINQEF